MDPFVDPSMDPFKDAGIYIPSESDAVQALLDIKPITLDKRASSIVMISKFTQHQKQETFHHILKFPESDQMVIVEALFNTFKGYKESKTDLILFAYKIFKNAIIHGGDNLVQFIKNNNVVDLFTKYLGFQEDYCEIENVFGHCEMCEDSDVLDQLRDKLGFSYEKILESQYYYSLAHVVESGESVV